MGRESDRSRLPREAIPGVHFEVFSWLGELERLLELVRIRRPESLSPANLREYSRWFPWYGSAFRRRCGIEHVLVDEAFDVELSKDHTLSRGIEAEDADVLVHFTLWISLLRRIGAAIANLDESRTEDALVLPRDGAIPRLAFCGSGPSPNESREDRERILLRWRLRRRRERGRPYAVVKRIATIVPTGGDGGG